jgi:hypothetical protein
MHLMLMGHVGVVVAIPSVILSFLNTGGGRDWTDQLLILYGQQETLLELDQRRAGMEGDVKHMLAVTQQMEITEQGIKN